LQIVWFSWKDIKHPASGGAEIVTHNLLSRLASDGHDVTLITSKPRGLKKTELINKYKVLRGGGRLGVYWCAFRIYKSLNTQPDLVIEEVNTIPFFTRFYTRSRRYLFFHQLAREIWLYQIWWPLSWIGYLLEPLYLRLLGKVPVITVSSSSKKDLQKHGIMGSISIIHEGIEIQPLEKLSDIHKSRVPTLLSLGSVRPMKRTLDIVKAFEVAKSHIKPLKLVIAGDISGPYAEMVLSYVAKSSYKNDIEVLGRVSNEQKVDLVRRCHVVAMSSIKEGWGLVVTEANSQGTPCVVYDVDGLRDSVKEGVTGFVVAPNSVALGDGIVRLLNDQALYSKLQEQAWQDSKQYTFDNTYQDFCRVLGI